MTPTADRPVSRSRHVLLRDPARTPLAPLVERTLLQSGEASRAVALRLAPMSLADALAKA